MQKSNPTTRKPTTQIHSYRLCRAKVCAKSGSEDVSRFRISRFVFQKSAKVMSDIVGRTKGANTPTAPALLFPNASNQEFKTM
jgi:hypothetical protein